MDRIEEGPGNTSELYPNRQNATDRSDAQQSFREVNLSPNLSSAQISVIVKCTLMLVVVVVGVFGNTLLFAAYRTTPGLWTKSNMLVAGLAVVEIIHSGPTLIYYVTYQLLIYVFYNDPCKYRTLVAIFTPLQRMSVKVINLTFIVIALDRYIAVVYPMHYETKITERKIKFAIGVCWIYGIALTCIFYCWLINANWSSCSSKYPTMLLVVVDLNDYSWASLVLIGVYGRILMIAIRQQNKISNEGIPIAIALRNQHHSTKGINSETDILAKKKRKEFKATRMTAAIVCPYVIFWLPFHIGRALQASGIQQSYVTTMLDIGLALGSAIQAVDWIIYGAINKQFKQAFQRLLKLKCNF